MRKEKEGRREKPVKRGIERGGIKVPIKTFKAHGGVPPTKTIICHTFPGHQIATWLHCAPINLAHRSDKRKKEHKTNKKQKQKK
jgi:hypothetical protein